MDAIRTNIWAGLFILALASGCAPQKTSQSVFPDDQGKQNACGQPLSEERFLVLWEDGSVSVEESESSEKFREEFVQKNLHRIKFVERDFRIQIQNDLILKSEQVSSMASEGISWGPQLIQAESLWNSSITGQNVVVGVVDGMVDATHGQLRTNVLENKNEIASNGIDDDHNGFVDDYLGLQVNKETNDPVRNKHGTHVAGIILADASRGPVMGVAPKAKLVSAQFIDNTGGGSIGDAIIAMNYVVDRGAKVLNLSWGSGPCVQIPTLKTALQQISDKGVLIVTAAGNGDQYGVGINVDVYPSFPSSYNFSNQINVAATTADDYMIGFSNYGSRTVHIGAPGVNIFSTVPGNSVESMSGTSMAAPMTSGSAALLWSAFPTATAQQIKQALLRGVDIVPGRNLEVSSRGRLNVLKSYQELRRILGL